VTAARSFVCYADHGESETHRTAAGIAAGKRGRFSPWTAEPFLTAGGVAVPKIAGPEARAARRYDRTVPRPPLRGPENVQSPAAATRLSVCQRLTHLTAGGRAAGTRGVNRRSEGV